MPRKGGPGLVLQGFHGHLGEGEQADEGEDLLWQPVGRVADDRGRPFDRLQGLREPLALNMAGPVEKPVRSEVLESLLSQLKSSLVP